jgi:ankyrin repeat protein
MMQFAWMIVPLSSSYSKPRLYNELSNSSFVFFLCLVEVKFSVFSISAFQVHINTRDQSGQTALHIACDRGNLSLVRN